MTDLPPPGLGRRLLALSYDALLLAALLMVAAAPWTLVLAPPPGASGTHWVWRLGFQLYLLAVIFGFFGWFWTHGGQTLGMRAWRVRLIDARSGNDVGWPQAARRFAGALISAAALGFGFLMVLFDRDRRAWHDRWSDSRLVLLPKRSHRPAEPAGAGAQPTRRRA